MNTSLHSDISFIDEYWSFLQQAFVSVQLNAPGKRRSVAVPFNQIYVPPRFRSAQTTSVAEVGLERFRLRSTAFANRLASWEEELRWFADEETNTTIDQLIERHRRLVILGQVGTGKSSSLISTVSKLCDQRQIMPLFFQLRCCNPGQEKKEQLGLRTPDAWSPKQATRFCMAQLAARPCMLLFDGLDEVETAQRQEVLERINSLSKIYPNQVFVLTSRPDAYSRGILPKGFAEYFIESLDAPRLERWVRRYYRSVPGADAQAMQRFVEAMRSGALLFSEGLSPLLLKTLVHLQLEGLDLQRAPAVLGYRCLQQLLEEWDASKGTANLFTTDYKLGILQPVALSLLEQGVNAAPINRLEDTVIQRCQQQGLRSEHALPLLDEIARRNGVLVSNKPGYLGFSQPWMLRCLAARELLQQADGAEQLANHIGRPEWEETALFYAGQTDASVLVSLLLEADDPFSQHLLMAGRCAVVAGQLENELLERVVEDLIRLCKTSPFAPLVSRACVVLGALNSSRADQFLHDWLQGPQEDRRRQVVSALVERPVESFEAALTARLQHDKARQIRALAADAMGRLGTESAQHELAKGLNDASWEVRIHVLAGMGWSGDEQLVDVFSHILEQGFRYASQYRGAHHFARLFAGMEEQSLRQSADDKDSEMRQAAARGLVALETPRAMAALERLMSHPNGHVRLTAAYGLGLVGDPRIYPLFQQGARHQDESIRYALTGLMNYLLRFDLSRQLYQELATGLLQDPCWRVRGGLLAGWQLDVPDFYPRIEALVNDPVAYVHTRAVRALGYLRGDHVTERLLALFLQGPWEGQVMAAVEGLRRHGCGKAQEAVMDRLTGGINEHTARYLLYYLLDLGTPQVLSCLADFLDYAGPELRGLAFEAIRRICQRHHYAVPLDLAEKLRQVVSHDAVFLRRYDTSIM
jgi:HEAT repeat protein